MTVGMSLGRLSRAALSLLGLVAILAAMIYIWARVAHTLQHAHPAGPPSGRLTAVVWGERVFTNRAALAYWLAERDRTYAEWQQRHPRAGRILGAVG